MQGQHRHPVTSPKSGQFVLHAKALHGNPFAGHTLGPVIADMEKLTDVKARRIHVDKGYRGHNHPRRSKVWISGQVRRVTASIRRGMKRRAAVEPVIGHVKAEHRMDRNHLNGHLGDRINVVLPAAGSRLDELLAAYPDLPDLALGVCQNLLNHVEALSELGALGGDLFQGA
ncbi:hypothetical protein ACVIHH_008310 [Bradyrhizobium sp. USDA 4518]